MERGISRWETILLKWVLVRKIIGIGNYGGAGYVDGCCKGLVVVEEGRLYGYERYKVYGFLRYFIVLSLFYYNGNFSIRARIRKFNKVENYRVYIFF